MLRLVAACLILLLSSAAAGGAELYYLDRDPFTDQYTGPVGPLVLSGEIVPGDYALFLARIAEDPDRFLQQDKLILASNEGDAAEAIKIAKLVKSLDTQVSVGPLTGRCAGACFLIYAAAAQRGTDGESLLGLRRPGLAESEWVGRPTTEAALLEDAMQAPVREFLVENDVPAELIEQMFKLAPTDAYWLTESDEAALGAKSSVFQQFLAKSCGWNPSLDRALYRGEFDEAKKLAACSAGATQTEARKALVQALKDASVPVPASLAAAEAADSAAPAGHAAASPAHAKPHPAHAKPAPTRAKVNPKPPAESKTTPSS
ncbi:MAG TPA: hypothetical protein VME42_07115 [Steroidobacteraceae bacterium]|nr:hypothetical protein [Steroidobacteraceae bacterium]